MTDVPQALRRILRKGNRPLLWLGAGASCQAEPALPTLLGLVDQLKDEFGWSNEDADPYVVVDEFLSERVGTEGDLAEFLNRKLRPGGLSPQPGPLHRSLAGMFAAGAFSAVVDTNYDLVLRRALDERRAPYQAAVLDRNLQLRTTDDVPRYVSLHGSFDDWRSVVLTGGSYARFEKRHPLAHHKVEVWLREQPILFVGCSMTDPRFLAWATGLSPEDQSGLKTWLAIVGPGEVEALKLCAHGDASAYDILGPIVLFVELPDFETLPLWFAELAGRVGPPVGSTRKPARSRLFGRPRDPSVRFFGRTNEVAQVTGLLRGATSARTAVSLEGLPGVGKTELALQLVHELAAANDYPGGIYWLEADSTDLTAAWAGTIAEELEVTAPVEERAHEALRHVSSQPGAVLVVLDNVGSWSQQGKPGPLPAGAHVHFLITTVQRDLGGTAFETVRVDTLGPEAARLLLIETSGREVGSLAGLQGLQEYLGGHPLAVELAGAYLAAYPEETPETYLAGLNLGGDAAAVVSDKVRYGKTVSQALHLFWRRLDVATRNAWQLAAWLEPELATPAFCEAMGVDRQSRRKLRDLHLLESGGNGGSRMHRLVSAFGRELCDDEERSAARLSLVRAAMGLLAQVDINDPLGFRVYLVDRPHVDAAVACAEEAFGGAAHFDVSALFLNVAAALNALGNPEEARALLRQAVSIDESAGDLPTLAVTYSNLAMVELDLGSLAEARRLMTRALAIDEKHLGCTHPSLAVRYANLAAVEQKFGNLVKARGLLRRAITICEETPGPTHPSLATYYSNLGMLELDLGNRKDAKQLIGKAIGIDEETQGPSVAARYMNLAAVEHKSGDLIQARALMTRALSINEASFGSKHPRVALNYSNLAGVLLELGKFTEARRLLKRALSINIQAFGTGHPSIAVNYTNLSGVEHRLGNLRKARRLLRRALAVDKRAFDVESPTLAASHSNLAGVELELGNRGEAKRLLRRAIAIQERCNGPSDREAVLMREHLKRLSTSILRVPVGA